MGKLWDAMIAECATEETIKEDIRATLVYLGITDLPITREMMAEAGLDDNGNLDAILHFMASAGLIETEVDDAS